VADKHAWPSSTNVREHRGQLVDDPTEGTWAGGHVAPRKTGAVVRAHPRELRDFGLYEYPTERGGRNTGFQQHHRSAFTATERMKAVPTDVNQEAGRSNLPPTTSADRLIKRANAYERNNHNEDCHILDR
jgi:hypothetical protein